jgi:hypothetical protein
MAPHNSPYLSLISPFSLVKQQIWVIFSLSLWILYEMEEVKLRERRKMRETRRERELCGGMEERERKEG